eukprot:4675630-Prorocentrum_lima.AAC.1
MPALEALPRFPLPQPVSPPCTRLLNMPLLGHASSCSGMQTLDPRCEFAVPNLEVLRMGVK